MTKEKSILTDIDSQLKDLDEDREIFSKKKRKVVRNIVKALQSIVNINKHIESVRWSQYTPYFNDGEECTFQILYLEYKLSGVELGIGSKWLDDDGYSTIHGIERILCENKDILNFEELERIEYICRDMHIIHCKLDAISDALLNEFGDHAQITISKKDITVTTYDHD